MSNGFLRASAAALLGLLLAVVGPGCADDATPPETSTETLYPYGHRRDEIARRYGSGGLIWIRGTPEDEFAAAIARQLMREGKPKPVAYETFLHHRGTTATNTRDYDLDYVFYTSDLRVLYSTRRSFPPSETAER